MSRTAPAPRPPSPDPSPTTGLRATLLVAAVMLVVVLVPFLLNRSVVGAAPMPVGSVVGVGEFRYRPAAGWQVDRAASQADRISVLVKGATRFRLAPLGRQSTAKGAFKAAARRYEAGGRGRVGDDPATVTTARGLTGLVAPITGNTVAGTLTVLIGEEHGLSITLTARHTAPLTAAIADDVVTMIDSVEVVPS